MAVINWMKQCLWPYIVTEHQIRHNITHNINTFLLPRLQLFAGFSCFVATQTLGKSSPSCYQRHQF